MISRTDEPRPTTYSRLPAGTDLRRPFAITVGLRPGYGDEDEPPAPGSGGWFAGPQHDRHRVVAAHGMWMAERIRAGRPYLTGIFTDGLVGYAWPRPETGQEPVPQTEECLVLSGEVSVLYAAHVADFEVEEMLDELAGRLAAAADQVRVYVAYRDRTWVLEAGA